MDAATLARPIASPGATGRTDKIGRVFFAVALLPSAAVALTLWVLPIEGLTADRSAMAARDYTALWAAGRLAAAHAFAALGDPARFTATLRAWFGAGFPAQIWPYPPPILLLATPLSALPLLPGYVLYTVAAPGLLLAVLRAGGLGWGVCLVVAFSPAMADNALTGQNAALTATSLLGGLLLVDRRPVLAGTLLGLLVLKPQLALLAPVCLVAGRRWTALIAASVSALALAALSEAVFGTEAWTEFLFHTRPLIGAYLERPWQGLPSQQNFASAFMTARSLGASLSVAYAVQGALTLICAALAWRAWRGEADRLGRVALTAALTLLASPWVHAYDMPPLAAAVALLHARVSPAFRPLLGLAWFWPGAVVLIPIPMAICVLSVASIVWLGWRSRLSPQASVGAK